MNKRVKSTAILMALVLAFSVFTSLAAVSTVAAATTTPTAEAATTAVATTTATPTTMPAAAVNATPTVVAATATTTTITASNRNPAVGSSITLTVTVKAGTTVLTNKQVTVTHTYPGGTTPGSDGVFNTGSTGTKTFSSGTYSSAGQRVYTAVFAGDGTYAKSSGTVTVNVGTKALTPTTTTITASNTIPAVGSAVTLSVTVKAGTTVLTNKQVTVTHTYPGGTTPGSDGVFNTGSTGTKTFSSGTYSSAGQRVYTAVFAGDGAYAKSSGTVTVNVGTTKATAVSLYSTRSTAYATQFFTLYGWLKDASGDGLVGQTVQVWIKGSDDADFWHWQDVNTGSLGHYTCAVALGKTSTFQIRFAGDATHLGSQSNLVTVTVQKLTVRIWMTASAHHLYVTPGSSVSFTVHMERYDPQKNAYVPLSERVRVTCNSETANNIFHSNILVKDVTTGWDGMATFSLEYSKTLSSPVTMAYYEQYAGAPNLGYAAAKGNGPVVSIKFKTALTISVWRDNWLTNHLEGFLLDQHGNHLAGRTVLIEKYGSFTNGWETLAKVKTDANGMWSTSETTMWSRIYRATYTPSASASMWYYGSKSPKISIYQ